MSRTAKKSAQTPNSSFEATLERLQFIVERLGSDALELEESLALFEEGVGLLRAADGILEGAEARIQQLLDDGRMVPLETPEPSE